MENILSPEILAVVCFAALLVGIINTVFGVGGSLLAYPILLHWLPDKIIIGVLSIIVIMVTAHRIFLFHRALSFRAIRYFLLLGIPSSVAGAFLLSKISVDLLRWVVGVFLIVITLHDWLNEKRAFSTPVKEAAPSHPPKSFIAVGGVSGFLTGLIGSAGVINTAFLLRAGFNKEAISVNQAGIALAYSLIKFPVYWKYEIITPSILLAGVIATTGSASGTFLGSYLLRKLSVRRFTFLLRILILVIGFNFLGIPRAILDLRLKKACFFLREWPGKLDPFSDPSFGPVKRHEPGNRNDKHKPAKCELACLRPSQLGVKS
jgi:uncharacterized membrane protein YfcA